MYKAFDLLDHLLMKHTIRIRLVHDNKKKYTVSYQPAIAEKQILTYANKIISPSASALGERTNVWKSRDSSHTSEKGNSDKQSILML